MKTQDTYFIFGEHASRMYYNGESESKIKEVIMRGDAELYHHKKTDTLDVLLSAFCGYGSYVIISKEEYLYYSTY